MQLQGVIEFNRDNPAGHRFSFLTAKLRKRQRLNENERRKHGRKKEK